MIRQMIELETFQSVDKIRVSISGFFSYGNKTEFSSSLKAIRSLQIFVILSYSFTSSFQYSINNLKCYSYLASRKDSDFEILPQASLPERKAREIMRRRVLVQTDIMIYM